MGSYLKGRKEKMMNKDEIKAAQVLQEARTKRLQECGGKIAKLLDEYDAKILPEFHLLGNSVRSGWLVVDRGSGSPVAFPGGNNNPVVE